MAKCEVCGYDPDVVRGGFDQMLREIQGYWRSSRRVDAPILDLMERRAGEERRLRPSRSSDERL